MFLRRGVTLFLVASIISTPVAAGARAERVAEKLTVDDPAGDANYLNSQYLVIRSGDVAGPVDASAAADILALWFTHDRRSVTAHVQTEAPPSPSDPAYLYRIQFDPGVNSNCLWIQAVSAGDANPAGPFGRFQDTCSQGSEWSEEDGIRTTFRKGPSGTGVVSITVPRTMHPLFENGGDLQTPHVSVRNFHYDLVYAPQIDDTRFGTTYRLPPP
jgi:hypothetical protein